MWTTISQPTVPWKFTYRVRCFLIYFNDGPCIIVQAATTSTFLAPWKFLPWHIISMTAAVLNSSPHADLYKTTERSQMLLTRDVPKLLKRASSALSDLPYDMLSFKIFHLSCISISISVLHLLSLWLSPQPHGTLHTKGFSEDTGSLFMSPLHGKMEDYYLFYSIHTKQQNRRSFQFSYST